MTFSRLPSDHTIGIIGSGQLGLMIVLESARLGVKFNVLGNKRDYVCKFAKCFDNSEDTKFLDDSTLVTFEFEQGNEEAMIKASDEGKLVPEYKNVWMKIERDREKQFLFENGFPVARFVIAQNGKEALKIIRDEFNWSAVIKKVRGGYNGKGQYYIRNMNYDPQIEKINEKVVVEEFIEFDHESSIIVTRSNSEFVSYPVSHNVNKEGILLYNYGPIRSYGEKEIARKLADKLNYRGTMGIEFFVNNGKAIINEFSPRVHNSGHYTTNSSFTSQFENHIRGISNSPLGATNTLNYFGMINLLGVPSIDPLVENYGNIFWYNKENTTPRRKVGHINISGESIDEVINKIEIIQKMIFTQRTS